MDTLITILKGIGPTDILDILIVSYVYYKIYKVISKTRAIQLFKGVILFFILFRLASIAELRMVSFALENLLTYGLLALVILFQPELRRALEFLGRSKLFNNTFFGSKTRKYSDVIDELVEAIVDLSDKNIGALMVFENDIGLKDVIETGTELDAEISSSLIKNIFTPNTPLHDGAMVIRGERIVAAGCLLPLSNDRNVNRDLGTRHRAALGMSSVSDAFIIVVSEETGVITLAQNSVLKRFLDKEALEEIFKTFYESGSKGMLSVERSEG